MKIAIIILSAILGIFLLSQIWVYFSMSKIEYQDYQLLEKSGDFEIRYYPEAIVASTSSQGNYEAVQNNQFRILANYIFGGNKQNQKIEMTSPVAMEMGSDSITMSFVMPKKWSLDNLPETADARVSLRKTEPVYVAAIRFSGFSDQQKIEDHQTRLQEWLQQKGLAWKGNFTYLGYNPPWQIIGRRNEVIVALDAYAAP